MIRSCIVIISTAKKPRSFNNHVVYKFLTTPNSLPTAQSANSGLCQVFFSIKSPCGAKSMYTYISTYMRLRVYGWNVFSKYHNSESLAHRKLRLLKYSRVDWLYTWSQSRAVQHTGVSVGQQRRAGFNILGRQWHSCQLFHNQFRDTQKS